MTARADELAAVAAAGSGGATAGGLPALLVLTDRVQCRRPLPDIVAAAVDGGARAVVLREKDLPLPQRRQLADSLAALLAPVDGSLLVAGGDLLGAPAQGLHLAAGDRYRPPRPPLVGRSCHDAAAVVRAAGQGCDYVTVSPYDLTASKPGYGPPLGPAGLARLAALPGAPKVYALGGVTPASAAACRAAGAAGVAVMGAVMRADSPERCVRALLDALLEETPGREGNEGRKGAEKAAVPA